MAQVRFLVDESDSMFFAKYIGGLESVPDKDWNKPIPAGEVKDFIQRIADEAEDFSDVAFRKGHRVKTLLYKRRREKIRESYSRKNSLRELKLYNRGDIAELREKTAWMAEKIAYDSDETLLASSEA